jgi:hypothetical protein
MNFENFLAKACKDKIYMTEKANISLYELSKILDHSVKKNWTEKKEYFFKDFIRLLKYEYDDACDVDFTLFGSPKITETKGGYTLKTEISINSKPLSNWCSTYFTININADEEKNIKNISVNRVSDKGDYDPWLEKSTVLNICTKMAPHLFDMVFFASKYNCNKYIVFDDNTKVEVYCFENGSRISVRAKWNYDRITLSTNKFSNCIKDNYKANQISYGNEELIFKNILIDPLALYSLDVWEEMQMSYFASTVKKLPVPKKGFFTLLKEKFFK